MVLTNGKLKGYPQVNFARPEIDTNINDPKLLGGMCYTMHDWAEREAYIQELEERLKGARSK